MSDTPEPRNPLYLLLLLASLLFVLTALAYALVPVLEQKAADAGQPPPPSPFRDALRADGWLWLLCEVAAMIVLGLASMLLDRARDRRRQPEQLLRSTAAIALPGRITAEQKGGPPDSAPKPHPPSESV
jgi:hypothetical protein